MQIVRLEQNINNQGEHRVVFVMTIDGEVYEFTGFVDKTCKRFEFAKNELSWFEREVGKIIGKLVANTIKDNEVTALRERLKELEG